MKPPIPVSVPSMVQQFLGTEYDTVKLVADQLETIKSLANLFVVNGYFKIPEGTEANRPNPAEGGMFYYDVNKKAVFAYSEGVWANITGSATYTIIPRVTTDGTTITDIGLSAYINEYTLVIFRDAVYQRPITDYTINSSGAIVWTTAPAKDCVVDIIRLASFPTGLQQTFVLLADEVPATTELAQWFINTATGRVYFKVAGQNADYWVEQNSAGRL